ncbi:MAG: AMP-binding protein [Proteobacteria bacterium]|nr:AMP-binding protein [Pseudomonadota bacterium]
MTTAFPLEPEAPGRHLIPLLRRRAALAPRAVLVSHAGRAVTAEDLLLAGERRARSFASAGLSAGDRVALQCGNRIEFLEVLVACALSGLMLVPINTASRGEQLAYYLRNSRARVFVTEPTQLAHLQKAHLADPAAIDAVEAIWSLDPCDAVSGLRAVSAWPEADAPADTRLPNPDPTAPAIVMYTSGTSGPSKGVMCSHAQLYWWGHASIRNIGVEASDVLYTCLPLFHVNALNTFYQAIASGARMAIGAKFSVSQFFQDLTRTEATVTYLLGAMVPMLLSRAPDASERTHCVRVALAPGATESHYDAFEGRTGIRILDGFGSTESNFVICSSIGERRPGWMGKVASGFDARVVDEQDNEVPPGTPGELVLRNHEPFAFASGYFEMPQKTVEAWRNLWFHTGDRVVRDEQGYFKFLDRIKDSIRRRGENISSYEVEQVLGSAEGVESVAAYAVASELAEDEVMCAVVPRPGAALDPLALIRWCEPRLPYFAVPRFLRFVTDLPKTENGKVQKYKLRAEGVTPDTWDLATSGHVVQR